MRTKNFFLTLLLAAMISVPAHLGAQITIGSGDAPQSFSVLELISNQGGLRLPQMTTTERNIMMETDEFQNEKTGKAVGLMIFNTYPIPCLEFWNGLQWISLCESILSPVRCGAYTVKSDVDNTIVWREFMCHNLGADTGLDPFTPHPGLHGAVFKWGTGIYALTAAQNNTQSPELADGTNWADLGGRPPTGTTDDWNMATANPCPPGFRVPTKAEWEGVIANNPVRSVGDWTPNNNPYPQGNFSSGIFFGDALFLPAAGLRSWITGAKYRRGEEGHYWSSTASGTTAASELRFKDTAQNIVTFNTRISGYQVRCIAE